MLGVAGGVAAAGAARRRGRRQRGARRRATVACPAAPLLAGALRRAGLTVHVGPIATQPRLARGRGRAAAGGDRRARGRHGVGGRRRWPSATGRFAAVRVIVDTAAEPLLQPGIVRTARRAARRCAARRRSSRSGPPPSARARCVLAAPRSFCAGVERAIDIVERALDRYGAPVYVRRQIVHNAHVVARPRAARRGLRRRRSTRCPTAHGRCSPRTASRPAVRAEAADRGLAVIDATCPLVARCTPRCAATPRAATPCSSSATPTTRRSRAPSARRRTRGRRGRRRAAAAARCSCRRPGRVAYVMQTTLAVDEAEQIAGRAARPVPRAGRRRAATTSATRPPTGSRRCARSPRDCDLVLVVGSPNSSNSLRLVEVAERAGAAAYLVDDASEVDLAGCAGVRPGRHHRRRVGAAAPGGRARALPVRPRPDRGARSRAVDENVTFTLPREVS